MIEWFPIDTLAIGIETSLMVIIHRGDPRVAKVAVEAGRGKEPIETERARPTC